MLLVISIDYNKIGDEGAKAISNLKNLNKLGLCIVISYKYRLE